MKKGAHIRGYRAVRVETIEELEAAFIELVHEKSGARHIHIENEDKENTFGVVLRTVPEDSSGIAHILEHTVLCGSRKFDVRDPFFSMLKRGLATFMNALTASDWTMYPFSTQNKKDYYNLMDVYLDAVFFPKLDRLSFKQEGIRLEVVDGEQGAELVYKGVVYNEMKGAMSSPREVMGRSLLNALYPSTTYCFNSGGAPSEIPRLTHEDLLRFHAKYYNPANAFFYTYGSFDLSETLGFIEEKVLSKIEKQNIDTRVPPQPRWKKPREATYYYSLSQKEDASKKHQGCVAWLTPDIKDAFEVIVMTVLEQVLLGNASSPLRKALMDSGIGTALSDVTGFDADMRDTMFVCGLKEIDETSVKQVAQIVFRTLEDLVAEGIDKKAVQSAIHQIEFYRKERTNTPYPYGIKLLLTFVGTWIHEADPLRCIKFDRDLEKLKKLVDRGGFLEEKIRAYFLENPHRVLFTLSPDPDMEERALERTRAELASLLEKMDREDIERIKRETEQLAAIQEKEEDLSQLPSLSLEDVPPAVEVIKPDHLEAVAHTTCYHQNTAGILYFTGPFGTGGVQNTQLSLVPFFCKAFTGSGTQKRDYAGMAELMDLYTGGVSISPFAGTGFCEKETVLAFLSYQGKALETNVEKLFDILSEFVAQAAFSDLIRLERLLYEFRAQLEASIVANGHRYALSLSSRHLNGVAAVNEVWRGIHQYRFIKQLIADIEKGDYSFEDLSRDLNNISAAAFRKKNIKPALVGGAASIVSADRRIRGMADSLSDDGGDFFEMADMPAEDASAPWEGWYTNTAVSFVGQSFKAVRTNHPDSPALAVISKLLRSLYLHREIREKGGAYGGFALYDYQEGIFSFASFRDPNIRRTLAVYRNACDFIKTGDYTDDDIKEAVLQVCADIDKPETPGPASLKAYYRRVMGLSDEMRQNFKASLLSIDQNTIREAAHKYFAADDPEKGTAVISSKDMLTRANSDITNSEPPLTLNRI